MSLFDVDKMTERERDIAEYWKQKGLDHSEPSPETKTKLTNMSEKIDEVKDSIRDLTTKVALIADKFEDDGIIQEIRKEVKSTNGKVAAQEIETRRLVAWRNYLTGAFAVLGVIVLAVLIPLSISFLKSKIEQPQLTEAEVLKLINKERSADLKIDENQIFDIIDGHYLKEKK